MVNYFKMRKEAMDNIKDAINNLSGEGVINKRLTYNRFFYPRSYINKLLTEIEDYKHDIEYTSFNGNEKNKRIIGFGFSRMKKPLNAFVINDIPDFDNTILITGVMHGFEGAFSHDGKLIYDTLNETACYYSNNNDILNKTRIIIVPCCNPDGLFDGKSDKKFGRKTANNTDINRDFGRFNASETVEISNLMLKYKPDIYIDVHGWLNALYGDDEILKPFYNNCLIDRKYPNQFGHGKGYAISYAKNNFKSKCALVEFNSPDEISPQKMVMAINELLGLNLEYNFIDEQTMKITKGYCDMIRASKDLVKTLLRRNGGLNDKDKN